MSPLSLLASIALSVIVGTCLILFISVVLETLDEAIKEIVRRVRGDN